MRDTLVCFASFLIMTGSPGGESHRVRLTAVISASIHAERPPKTPMKGEGKKP